MSKSKRSSGNQWTQEQYALLNSEQRATVEQWVEYLQRRELRDEGSTLPWLTES